MYNIAIKDFSKECKLKYVAVVINNIRIRRRHFKVWSTYGLFNYCGQIPSDREDEII